ncbi:MAG: hypothetical protein HYY79_12450 [Betaproteobacteria bacterium]|nr:hypothetical protein [Betaproteobacteria bacterium]
MTGSLMGQGVNGAGLVFSFSSSTTPNRATGSVVFGNPTYNNGVTTVPFEANPLMDYRLGLVASGMSALGAITKDGSPTGPLVSEEANYAVQGGAISSSRTQFVSSETALPVVNPQGALIKFDGPYRFAFNSCSPSICNSETQIAARYALADATGGGPTITNLPGTPPTARSVEFGFDQDTGVRWGRWGGGFINVGDRASANQAGTVPLPNGTGSINQIDLTVQNWHYLITTGQGGPVVLPVSGTANYQLVGATSPTSFTPGQAAPDVGTLTSATLTANFTARTVDVAVNAATPASGTWAANATGVPIQKGTFFEAQKSLSGMGPLSVTRNGSPAGTAGQIVGGFAGQTGRGAGIAYSLNQGGPTGTTVSGVAVFKR